VLPPDPFVERLAGICCRRLGGRQGAAQDRVRSEAALVGRPVQLDEGAVERGLVGAVQFANPRGDLAVDVGDGVRDAFPVGIAQLDRFEASRRGARRNRRPAEGARLQPNVDLDSRVAA
jgi:hypothetical protein